MIIIITVVQLLAPDDLIADTDTIHLTREYFNSSAIHSTEYLWLNLYCPLVWRAAERRARGNRRLRFRLWRMVNYSHNVPSSCLASPYEFKSKAKCALIVVELLYNRWKIDF